MARYVGPVCKLCRREGMKLFLKGSRCETVKCAIAKRAFPPGMHSFRRSKLSEYGQRLREKQKTKRFYGVLERQFKKTFWEAQRQEGDTGLNLLRLLERRLDNVIYSLGFAFSRPHARQMVAHGHYTVNGKKVDIPSYLVKVKDKIGVRERDKLKEIVKQALEQNKDRDLPAWLGRVEGELSGTVLQLPLREHVSLPVAENLIVELCSK